MGLYQNNSGVLTPIAGRGKMGFGISDYRYGTVTIASVPANNYAYAQVTFDKPMPDDKYIISTQNMGNCQCHMDTQTQTANGFYIYLTNTNSVAVTNVPVDWYAFKPYTDVEYNNMTALTHYSTTPQEIGTQIDGKTLWQVTFTMTTPASVGAQVYKDISSFNIDKIISEEAMLQRTVNNYDHAINWHYANNDHDMCTYFAFDTGRYYIYKSKGTSDCNANAYITLKYTKKS